MIPIGTDIDEAPPAALRKSFTKVNKEKRKKDEEALIAFVDTFRGYQVKILSGVQHAFLTKFFIKTNFSEK